MTPCANHPILASSYPAWQARSGWLQRRGYRCRACTICGRYWLWVAPDGRLVESFVDEYRMMREVNG